MQCYHTAQALFHDFVTFLMMHLISLGKQRLLYLLYIVSTRVSKLLLAYALDLLNHHDAFPCAP